jgi:hypothetical protein
LAITHDFIRILLSCAENAFRITFVPTEHKARVQGGVNECPLVKSSLMNIKLLAIICTKENIFKIENKIVVVVSEFMVIVRNPRLRVIVTIYNSGCG